MKKDVVEHVASLCQWIIVLCVHCIEPHPKCQEEVCETLCLDGWKLITCIMLTVAVMKLKDKNSQYSMRCSVTWLFCFNFIQKHLKQCKKYQVECPDGCGMVMQREKVHVDVNQRLYIYVVSFH